MKIDSFHDNHPLSKLTQAAVPPKRTSSLGSIRDPFHHQTPHRLSPWSFHTHQKSQSGGPFNKSSLLEVQDQNATSIYP